MSKPTPKEIKKCRKSAGLTQAQAATMINKHLRTWQKWEAGDQEMDSAFFELFLIKINQ